MALLIILITKTFQSRKNIPAYRFFENGGNQTLNIIYDRNNRYAKQIRTRIESSIEFNNK